MLLIRVLCALLLLALIPATASADLRSPMIGETSLLSDVPQSRTWEPAIATSGNTTFVAYMEERTGISVNRISATGTEIGATYELQSPGTASVESPQIVADGQDVYVAWIQGSYWQAEKHVVVAASHDGGSTWGQPVRAGRPTGYGAFDFDLAADGDHVFVAYTDTRRRVWTAGSRDGAKSFPCFAEITEAGDPGTDFSLAVAGDHVYWTWLSRGFDVMLRRSTDGGRTLEPMRMVQDASAQDHPGQPTVAADGSTVAIVFSKAFVMDRADGSGKDFGAEPHAVTSGDGGGTWTDHHVDGEGTRCVGDYCSAPYGVDVDAGRVYVTWRAKGKMWLAQSLERGAGFAGARGLGPYAYTWHTQDHPYVDAHGDSVVAVWHTAPDPATFDLDPIAAFSSDGGRSFSLRTVNTDRGKDLLPVAAAWGPDPKGAGFAWWTWDDDARTGDWHVRFAPMSAAAPDIEVVDVRPAQATQDAARLAAGRPTTIRTLLRSRGAVRTTARVKIQLSFDQDGKRVERTVEEDVVVRPGLTPVHLLADEPVEVGAGRITAKVAVNPNAADSDPANNTGEGSRAVVQPRALKVLFVPAAADDELPPACRDVQDVAEGTERFVEAAWPVDPKTFSVVTDCSSTLSHRAPLNQGSLMGPGQLMQRIDRLKYTAGDIDKVIAVVPQGWFGRQQIAGFETVLGIAPSGGGFDSGIVERQATGGWVVAHELAHSYGWTEDAASAHHLNDESAPGFWTTEQRDVPARIVDFMHFNTANASETDPVGRWTSKATWDFLTEELSTGEVVHGFAAGGGVLSLTGTVAANGAVTAGPGFELPGTASESDGAYTAELLNGAGAVVQTRRFGATNQLGPIGTAAATRDQHITTEDAAFSLQLPADDAARTLRVRRGEQVVLTRERSAAKPVVQVSTPARVELGTDLKVTWEASDADGDTLTSLVSISTDGGTTWRSLGDATTAKALTVKAIASIGGQDVRVRVTTTDGWNTTVSTSGAFVVGGQLTDGKIVVEDWFGGIVTADLDGGNRQYVATDGNEPRWSPDGRKLAWRDHEIFTANADGSNVRQLTHMGNAGDYLFPVWHPDGDRLVAERRRSLTHEANRFIDAETGQEAGDFGSPHGSVCGFSRDGSRALIASGYNPRTYQLGRADGTQAVSYPRAINGTHCMALSPDGRFGVVTRYGERSSVLDVIVYDLQTGAERNLTKGQFGGYNAYPTWSPTGEWIVWASNKDRSGSTGFGSTDIWKIRPDGTGAVKVLDGKPGNRSFEEPDVQPVRGIAADPEPTLAERDPQAAVAAATVAEGTQLTLNAGASKPGADAAAITAYAWDLDGDGVFTDAAGATPRASFPDEGVYPVSVLVTDAKGRSATASADVTVTNVAPAITEPKLGDGEPANFTAQLADPGLTDELTATLYWNDSATGETVPLIATGDGYTVSASRAGATAVRVAVADGDGGTADAHAVRVLAPVDQAPTAADATATVVAGESVDLSLPATDPEGGRLTYELVDAPARGSLLLREASLNPGAADMTYTAGDVPGPVTFTYRVTDGAATSRTATVTVEVTPRPDDPPVNRPGPLDPPRAELPRPVLEGAKPLDKAAVARALAPTVRADDVFTLPHAKACVSRRNFRIRVKRGDYRQVVVSVNGKTTKVLRGKRITAAVDLRGLPKGRFKVQIAATLNTGKVVKSSRSYRTCTKKGGRR